jgi:hypothetical protein
MVNSSIFDLPLCKYGCRPPMADRRNDNITPLAGFLTHYSTALAELKGLKTFELLYSSFCSSVLK